MPWRMMRSSLTSSPERTAEGAEGAGRCGWCDRKEFPVEGKRTNSRARRARRRSRRMLPSRRDRKGRTSLLDAAMTAAIPARALWLAAARTPELREERALPPGPGEVRVRAIASAISQGTEMLVYRGEVPAELPLDLPTLAGAFAFPIKYGYAVVGRVIDVGDGVESVGPGDVVFALHPHQSVFTAPVDMVTPLPGGIDPLAGVFTANLETAVNVLLDTPLKLGETVAVFGLGTVGLLTAQLLRRAGAGRVIGVEPLARRRTAGEAAGVD